MKHETKDLLEWIPEFDLGVEEIDPQHRYFMNLINRLNRAPQCGDERTRPVALLRELNACVKFHFISEENMMRFADYAHLADRQRRA